MSNQIQPDVCTMIHGAVDPTGSLGFVVFKAPAATDCVVEKIYVLHGTTRALHATDIDTATLTRYRSGSGTVIGSVSSVTATGTALAAYVPWEITISTAAYKELKADDVLRVVFTEGAADMDIAEVSVATEWSLGTGAGQ